MWALAVPMEPSAMTLSGPCVSTAAPSPPTGEPGSASPVRRPAAIHRSSLSR